MMPKDEMRPVLISVAHYLDELESGEMTVFDIIETADRLGAGGVELRREPWAAWENELESAQTEIERRGLLVTYATHITLFSADPGDGALLRRDIESAAALGSPLLRVFQGPAPANDDEAGWQAGQDAVDYAASYGIVLALENYARVPGGSVAEIKRVLDHIPSPALATNIDIANYTNHDEDVVAAIQAVGERAIYAHLKDKSPGSGDLTYLGGGTLPLPDILDALDRLPQRVIYCFEFRGGGEPEERIKRSLAYLQARQSKN
jgi:sugar phosphate isomerase/epimerase